MASTDAASLLIDTRGDMLASVGMECGMRTLRNARGQRLAAEPAAALPGRTDGE